MEAFKKMLKSGNGVFVYIHCTR